jgi:RNA polymerase-binding transcription factor DksA
MQKFAAMKERLEQRLLELGEQVEDLEEELRTPVSQSFEEQATEREGEEVLQDLENAKLAEIAAIRAALRRLKEGVYGVCASCGEPIAMARLELVPHAAFCIECASAQEKSH